MRHFSTTCAVHVEECEGWWLSVRCSSVAQQWLHKPSVLVLGLLPGSCWLFHFPLKTSKNLFLLDSSSRNKQQYGKLFSTFTFRLPYVRTCICGSIDSSKAANSLLLKLHAWPLCYCYKLRNQWYAACSKWWSISFCLVTDTFCKSSIQYSVYFSVYILIALFIMSRKNKFTIRISNDSFQCLVKHLQVSYSLLLWKIVHLFGILDLYWFV